MSKEVKLTATTAGKAEGTTSDSTSAKSAEDASNAVADQQVQEVTEGMAQMTLGDKPKDPEEPADEQKDDSHVRLKSS